MCMGAFCIILDEALFRNNVKILTLSNQVEQLFADKERGVDYEIPLVPIDRYCFDGLHRLPCFFLSWTHTACAYSHCGGCRGGNGAADRSPACSGLG